MSRFRNQIALVESTGRWHVDESLLSDSRGTATMGDDADRTKLSGQGSATVGEETLAGS